MVVVFTADIPDDSPYRVDGLLYRFILPACTDLPDEDASPRAWLETLGVPREPTPQFILIADPFTSPTAEILESLEMVAPGVPAVGALASGARRPGGHVLALNDTLHRSGLVGVSLAGNLRADVLV